MDIKDASETLRACLYRPADTVRSWSPDSDGGAWVTYRDGERQHVTGAELRREASGMPLTHTRR
jgi:hypothetical protein